MDLDLPLDLLCPNGHLLLLRPLFSVTRACVSSPKKSFLRISSLNRLFLIITNMTFPPRLNFLETPPKRSNCLVMSRVASMLRSHHQVRDLQLITTRSFLQSHSYAQQLIGLPLASNSSASASRESLLVRSLSHACFPCSSKECGDLSLWQHGCRD